MENDKQIIIQDGTGSLEIVNGKYDVSANVKGYNNASINPTSIDVTDSSTSFDFTISADGTLTLHVTETKEESGVIVQNAKFIRTDTLGQEYGTEIISDSNGNAVFEHVPYDADGTIIVYYKQTASDGNHNFDTSVKSVSMTQQTKTEEVENALPVTKTINLTDANYDNMPISEATLTLTNSETL